MDLELLLAHAGDGTPVLESPLPLDAGRRDPPARLAEPSAHLADPSGDPDVLSSQRWVLVVPEGPRGERLRALLDPLWQLRSEQQGRPADVLTLPAGADAEALRRFRDTKLWPAGRRAREQPRYVLLAGDPDVLPLELHETLAGDGFGFVGRLAFDDEEDYGAYAAKVVEYEKHPGPERRARSLFLAVRDGTVATKVGADLLMEPASVTCEEERQRGHLPANEVIFADGPGDPGSELLRLAVSPGAGVLLSLSHGVGAPRTGWASAEEQRLRQGALSLGDGAELTPRDVGEQPFMPGGAWFAFACYSAGTPKRSPYLPWLELLAQEEGRKCVHPVLAARPLDGRPFIAKIAQAALANPRGPVAFIGHLDLAWSTSFYDEATGRLYADRFVQVIAGLVKGRRVGPSLHGLTRFAQQVDVELRDRYQRAAEAGAGVADATTETLRLAQLWMMRHDLASYVVLGDPAGRLVMNGAGAGRVDPLDTRERARLSGPQSLSDERVEQAVLAVLSGERSAEDVARAFGMDASVLRTWADTYRNAGRAALRAIRGAGSAK
ncbi:MAG TPA: helix-turn-helix domain-containing protein [Myxococcaceae bacterium]|nr:helix-turn-helix domain-containing protein [Myxococcaceae bacterium]